MLNFNKMDILECRNITKKFGSFAALDDVSLSVPEGKIFGLLGPNGAGKTTMIRIINRITIPTDGTVFYQGTPMNEDVVRRIGYLPEERGLYKKMKVGEQCLYLAQLKGLTKQEATAELKKWFIKFDIRSWWDKKLEELSKGMAQKIQFITTVIHKPDLLILDEPFSGFDPVNTQVIRNEILRLRDEGTTIILSTHNMESVEELCDNIALINKSKLVVTGGTDAIREQYGSQKVEVVYRKNGEQTKEIIELGSGETNNAVLARLMADGAEIVSFTKLVSRMNDIFIKLVSE